MKTKKAITGPGALRKENRKNYGKRRDNPQIQKRKRRRLKSQINELIKANKDIFNLLVYGKSLDEHFLKEKGRQNLLEIEKLTEQAANVTAGAIKAPFRFVDRVLTKLFFED